MNKSKLALLGGEPIRKKIFSSTPMVDEQEINIVSNLMKSGKFSKFVGSPIPGSRKLLKEKSRNLDFINIDSNVLGGEYVRRFEALWSKITTADYSISVNSATSGLTTALLALGLEPGSEVITTPFSFSATCASIIAANCVPVFCDIDPNTFCLSPKDLKKTITNNTKCVIAVHWCGNAGDLCKIKSICRKNNIFLIEDAAQAPTSKYKCKASNCKNCINSPITNAKPSSIGTFGDLGVFSFNEPKNIMTGEGGLIVTNNQNFAIKCRLIRNHGEALISSNATTEELVNVIGYNFRMTEIHAAIAYIQTKKRKTINKIRKKNYQYLIKNILNKFEEYLIPQKITHPETFYAYTASFKWQFINAKGVHRNTITKALLAEGIPVFKGYHRLMCDHPMFKNKIAFGRKQYPWINNDINYDNVPVPNARKLVEKEFLGFLQMGYPNTIKDMDDIILGFDKIISNLDELKKYNSIDKSLNIGR